MTEGLFVLTVIFVAYVFYVVINEKKAQTKATPPAAEPEQQAISEPVAEQEPAKTSKPKAPTPVKSVANKEPVATKPDTRKKGLKNPKTGEIATTYNNYIFSKRWIKEALVTEGLLEKVYKNNELNAEIEAEIKAAIAKLEAMEQYKA